VAWISERKDLLAGLFFMLAVGAHVAHARKPGALRRASVALWLTLGLMAKPMLVTVPFVLLLIDAWPLGRLTRGSWRRCLVEKVPLVALSAAASLITYIAQARGGAVKSLDILPFPERLANAAVSYVAYLAKTLWPSRLAVVYPYPSAGLYAKAAAAGLLLAVVTGVAVRSARRRPFAAWGWFLYLGMLVPVIGLVQVGTQPLADRYTYLPLTGIFVAAAFLIPAPSAATRRGRVVAACAAALVGLLAAISHAQLRHWKNDYALYRHAAAVIEDNWEATGHAGFMAAWHARDREESLRYFRESLRVKPDNFMTHLNLGAALAEWGQLDQAEAHLRTALRLNPGSARVRSALARVLERQGRSAEAARLSREAAGTDQDRRMSPEQFRQWHPGIKKP